MKTMQEMVCEFHEGMAKKITVGETPAIRDPELRAALVLEEALEFVQKGLGYDIQLLPDEASGDAIDLLTPRTRWKLVPRREPNFVEAVDAVMDSHYVLSGTSVAFGIDELPYFAEVHRSNMEKANGPVDPVSGKQLKPPGWKPPRIAEMLEREIVGLPPTAFNLDPAKKGPPDHVITIKDQVVHALRLLTMGENTGRHLRTQLNWVCNYLYYPVPPERPIPLLYLRFNDAVPRLWDARRAAQADENTQAAQIITQILDVIGAVREPQ